MNELVSEHQTVDLVSTVWVYVRKVQVQIGAGMKGSQLSIASAPFGVGVAVDAMTMRRGGKQLPMEDVCLCEWPLQGFQEVSKFLQALIHSRVERLPYS